MLLSWEPGSDGLSPVRYYTVQYRELPDSNWTVHSASVSHETHSYSVDRYVCTSTSGTCRLHHCIFISPAGLLLYKENVDSSLFRSVSPFQD